MILRGGFFSARQMTDDGSLRLHVRPNQQSETASADPEGCCQVDNQDQKKTKKNKNQKITQHITLVLGSLHWLPHSHRITIRMCLLVHKSKNGACPKDLSDLLTQCKPSGPLGPAGSGLLAVPRVQTKHGEAAVSQLSWGRRLCCLL